MGNICESFKNFVVDQTWEKVNIDYENINTYSIIEKNVLLHPVFKKIYNKNECVYLKKIEEGKILYALEACFGCEEHPMLHLCDYAVWFPKELEDKKIGSLGFWIIGMDLNKNKYFSVISS